MSNTRPATTVYAAGAVLWRIIGDDIHVLVIHRTGHKDISLPKGKVDPGETLPQTAVREIREETGIKVALGVPLGATEYIMPTARTSLFNTGQLRFPLKPFRSPSSSLMTKLLPWNGCHWHLHAVSSAMSPIKKSWITLLP